MQSESTRREMQEQLESVEVLTFRVVLFLVACIGIYAASVGQSVGTAATPSPFLPWLSGFAYYASLIAGVALAGAVTGGFFGFLFGIPKLLQGMPVVARPPADPAKADPAKGAAVTSGPSSRTFAGNTNLEEISDWLTKIIVGISLTQYDKIYLAVSSLVNSFAQGAMPGVSSGPAIAFVTVLSAFVIGFLFFYLETRTRVTLLLDRADRWVQASSPQEILDEVSKQDTASSLQNLAPEAQNTAGQGAFGAHTSRDEEILKVPFEDLDTVPKLVTWGLAQVRTGNLPRAEQAFGAGVQKAPDDVSLQLALAGLRLMKGDKRAANAAMAAASQKFGNNPQVLKNKILTSLYLEQPQSFEEALAAESVLRGLSPVTLDDPIVQVWIAAANGQKFSYYSRLGDSARMAEAKEAALAAVRRAVELSPERGAQARLLMRRLFDPVGEKSALDDNDLEVFNTMPEFQTLIRPD